MKLAEDNIFEYWSMGQTSLTCGENKCFQMQVDFDCAQKICKHINGTIPAYLSSTTIRQLLTERLFRMYQPCAPSFLNRT